MEREATLTPAEARRAAGRAAELLAQDRRILLVYVFGSTLGTRRPRLGDVDLGVLAHPPLSLDELTRRLADLRQATGAPIELVSLDVAPVVLAHEVVESGACLFARDPDVETEFVTRTRARWWDFKPYLEAQWRLAGERLAERLSIPRSGRS